MTQAGQRIGTKICSLKTGRPRSSNAQGILEMLVQSVNETVREALTTISVLSKAESAVLVPGLRSYAGIDQCCRT